MERRKRIYKLVLTGGPCGGKTTGQARITTFFENLGWKVLRVPETATVLLSGGVKFSDLSQKQAFEFQENLLKTMVQIENTFFKIAEDLTENCIVICDRGVMDASTYLSKDQWDTLMVSNGWNTVEMRDNRYDHVIHMMSAANGAEKYYSHETNNCRSENLQEAREYDAKAALAWLGHPYFDIIDNSSQDFQGKVCRLIACICHKIGIDVGDRLSVSSRKVKFLVKGPIPADDEFPPHQDFEIEHDYLLTSDSNVQVRIRKRKQRRCETYQHTIRRKNHSGQIIEIKTPMSYRDYSNMLEQRDDSRVTVFKRRRSFLINNQFFQLDIYKRAGHPRSCGLMLLEIYTCLTDDKLNNILPKFLNIEKEVTGHPDYSMFNLSLRRELSVINQNNNDFIELRTVTRDHSDCKKISIPDILCDVAILSR